jgi:hypothetical protein
MDRWLASDLLFFIVSAHSEAQKLSQLYTVYSTEALTLPFFPFTSNPGPPPFSVPSRRSPGSCTWDEIYAISKVWFSESSLDQDKGRVAYWRRAPSLAFYRAPHCIPFMSRTNVSTILLVA